MGMYNVKTNNKTYHPCKKKKKKESLISEPGLSSLPLNTKSKQRNTPLNFVGNNKLT